MSRLFHLVFSCLHLVTIHKHVQSAPVLSTHDLNVEQLFYNGTLIVDCKDPIRENILSKPPQEWSQLFNAYKDFMIGSNDCNQTEYEILTRAACSKEESVVMTTRRITPTPKIHTSTRQTTLSTTTMPTTHISTHMSTHRTTTPTSMPKTTHTATTIPTTHMSTRTTTHTTTAPTMPSSAPTTNSNTNMNTTQGLQNVSLNSSPHAEATATKKLIQAEQTETPISALTTVILRRQTTDHGMLQSDTSTYKINTSSSITAEDFSFKTTEPNRRLEGNLEDLLQQATAYKNQTSHIEECQTAAMTKLTRESGVGKVCATVKQLKEILDEKCVKTDYDLLVAETFQLFHCVVCLT